MEATSKRRPQNLYTGTQHGDNSQNRGRRGLIGKDIQRTPKFTAKNIIIGECIKKNKYWRKHEMVIILKKIKPMKKIKSLKEVEKDIDM